MKSRYTRILSVLLCAALACSILAGCSTAASSSEAPSSADESQSTSASSEVLPDSTTRAAGCNACKGKPTTGRSTKAGTNSAAHTSTVAAAEPFWIARCCA